MPPKKKGKKKEKKSSPFARQIGLSGESDSPEIMLSSLAKEEKEEEDEKMTSSLDDFKSLEEVDKSEKGADVKIEENNRTLRVEDQLEEESKPSEEKVIVWCFLLASI